MMELLIVIICILLSGLFALAEMAFVCVEKSQIQHLAKSGNEDAKRLLSLRETPERTLAILQIGVTFLGAIAAATARAGIKESLDPIIQSHFYLSKHSLKVVGVMIVVLPLTYFTVVIGELVPKTLALRNPLRLALMSSRWLSYADWMMTPIVNALEWSTQKVLALFFNKAKDSQTPLEIEVIETTNISKSNQEYILNLADIDKKIVQDILLPMEQVIAIDKDDSIEKVASMVLTSEYASFPVFQGTTIVGILDAKRLMVFREEGRRDWNVIMTPIFRVEAQDSLIKVLREMQSLKHHLAIVYEANQQIGIVTFENIFKTIVG